MKELGLTLGMVGSRESSDVIRTYMGTSFFQFVCLILLVLFLSSMILCFKKKMYCALACIA